MSDILEFNSAKPIITNSNDLEEGEILSQTSVIVEEQNMEIEKNDIIQQESKIEFSFVAQSQAPQQVLNLEEKVAQQKLTKDQEREERSRSRSKKEKSHKDKKSKHKHDKHDKHDKKKKKKEHKHKDRKRSPSIDKDGKTIKKHEKESDKKAKRSRSISKSRHSRDLKDNRSRSRMRKDSRQRDSRDYDHRRSSRSNSRYEIYDRDQRRHYERRSDSREDRRHNNRVESQIHQSSKSSKDIKNHNHQNQSLMRESTQNQRGVSQFASDTLKVQTPKPQAVATFGSLSRDKKDSKTIKQKFVQSLEESKSEQDLSEDEEMIDEEEQIRREMEERQKRLQQLAALKNQTQSQQQMIVTAVQVQQNISPKAETSTLHANLDNKMNEAQVECAENQSTSLNENQVQEQISTDLAQTKPQVNIEGLNETQTQQSIDKKDLNEFYRMLDHQRKDWYDHQNQNELSNDKSQDVAQPAKTKKKFNMFDESSEEEDDHVTQAIEKGFEVKAAQVDVEGYYLPKVGELIRGKYKVSGIAGKGVFSCVVKALDINPVKKEYELVAIKIIRLHDMMRQSGVQEIETVQILNKSDPLDKKNIIRLLETFEYNNHLCLAYEQMELNLRETMHKYGRNVGLSLDGVCLFGRQLFQALQHLHKHKYIHADLKPDNIMVDKDAKKIKLCDFGSCLRIEEAVITEYMVSRFYRAPEIMLGCEFDQAIDIWSAGVTLYELYTGKVMFYGRSNNEMLKLIMLSKGKIKTKMLKKAQNAERHFNMLNLNVFLSQEEDPLNKGQFYQKPMPMPHQPQKPILQMLKSAHKLGGAVEDEKNLLFLADFLEKSLVIDPKKRMTADEALNHPFLNILIERMKTQQQTKQ
eukprot:403346545